MRRALLVLIAVVALAGCARARPPLELVFFDAGKADAILINTPNSAVLVDAGLDEDGEALANKLRARGVTRLDALIVTHFDKDHIGGADAILSAMPVDRVYEPSYAKDSKQFRQYRDALSGAGVVPAALTENTAFSLDGVDYAIDVANRLDYGPDEENDFSLVIRLTCGQASALLAGDAEESRLGELIGEGVLPSDVLKMPHHGRYNGNTRSFVDRVRPQLAVITSGAEQAEDAQTADDLAALGARVLYTGQGDVTLTWDGKNWTHS